MPPHDASSVCSPTSTPSDPDKSPPIPSSEKPSDIASSSNRAYILAGPTASGKTALAHELVRRHNFALLSADSMLVYQGMDVGTAKPSPAERNSFHYAGLDLVPPSQPCSAGLYLKAASSAIHAAFSKNRPLLIVGGTGLYIDLLLHGLDSDPSETPPVPPTLRAHYQALLASGGLHALHSEAERLAPGALALLADPENPRRVQRLLERIALGLPPIPSRPSTPPLGSSTAAFARDHFVVLQTPPPLLASRITSRIDDMFSQGLLPEVASLLSTYPTWSETASAAIGYAEAIAVLQHSLSIPEAKERIAIRTRQLAKRQRTWFRNRAPFATPIPGPLSASDIPSIADSIESLWNL